MPVSIGAMADRAAGDVHGGRRRRPGDLRLAWSNRRKSGQPDHRLSGDPGHQVGAKLPFGAKNRSEEHTSELQSLMRISYAVFCLKKKKKQKLVITSNTSINNTKTSIPEQTQ